MIRKNLRQIFSTERDYDENNYFGGDVVKGDGVAVNTYGYSDGVAKLHVDSANAGWFLFRQPNLKVGDIIEVECEMRTVNGKRPELRLFKGAFNNTGLLDIVPATQDEWEIVRHRHIVEEDNRYYIGVGYITADVGQAEFRNFSINFKTNTEVEWTAPAPTGGWEVFDGGYADIYDYPLEYRRIGNQVTVRGGLMQTTDANSKMITKFPELVYPKKPVYAIAVQKDGVDKTLGIRVDITGRFEVVSGSIELEKHIGFYFTYDID